MDEYKDQKRDGERPELEQGTEDQAVNGTDGWQGGGEDNRRTVILEEKPGRWRNPKRPGRAGLKIFLIILGLCLLLVMVFAVSCESKDDYGTNGPYIATLYIEGSIASGNADSFGMSTGYQHQWTLKQIDNLTYDSSNKGIMLYMDSPGGAVYESDELYLKLKDYQEITGRPVYTYMGAMAASGAYYTAAISDKIYANRNTWTGSIGVRIGTIYDISGFLERYGVKSETITSGVNKAMGSAVVPMTDQQKAIWQGLVNEAYEQFVGVVSEGRHLPVEEVRKIADGRIYSAKQALDLGLIDKIGTFEDAVNDMKRKHKLQHCDVVDVVHQSDSIWRSLFSSAAEALKPQAAKSDVAAVLSLIDSYRQMPISYTYQWPNQ